MWRMTSEARKLLWQDPEYRARQTASRKAGWLDPEYRARQTAQRRSRVHSEATKKKMSLIQIAAWRDPEYRRKHIEPRIGGMTVYERAVKASLENEGWTVMRNGWPDFLLVHADGRIKAVEVKGGRDSLRAHQRKTHEILVRLGITVEVIRINATT